MKFRIIELGDKFHIQEEFFMMDEGHGYRYIKDSWFFGTPIDFGSYDAAKVYVDQKLKEINKATPKVRGEFISGEDV